ncbi:MAG: putative baseplate assembly protein, partial [Blastocatellia bacterium]
MSSDPSIQNLNDCGCCSGETQATPLEVKNRPGLSAIAYRAGAYSDFRESMLAQLSDGGQLAPLLGLKTRDDGDFSVALLDSWAVVSDVLTFYQERIANESYLRTATQPQSVVELARALGYELNPGVAASTYLAFTVETAVGAPSETTVPAGTPVQSIPGPGEKPQTFETSQDLDAKAELNALQPRQTEPRIDAAKLYLSGIVANLKPGDPLFFVKQPGGTSIDLTAQTGGALRFASKVQPDNANNRTLVQWN